MKTKTLILLYRIMDDAVHKLVHDYDNMNEKEFNRQLYRYNRVPYIVQEILGCTNNNRSIYRKIKFTYDWLEVIYNLTIFQQTLFTEDEQYVEMWHKANENRTIRQEYLKKYYKS